MMSTGSTPVSSPAQEQFLFQKRGPRDVMYTSLLNSGEEILVGMLQLKFEVLCAMAALAKADAHGPTHSMHAPQGSTNASSKKATTERRATTERA